MTQRPEHVHRASALWWELVDDLVENNFSEEEAEGIVGEFFRQFKPIPRDRMVA